MSDEKLNKLEITNASLLFENNEIIYNLEAQKPQNLKL